MKYYKKISQCHSPCSLSHGRLSTVPAITQPNQLLWQVLQSQECVLYLYLHRLQTQSGRTSRNTVRAKVCVRDEKTRKSTKTETTRLTRMLSFFLSRLFDVKHNIAHSITTTETELLSLPKPNWLNHILLPLLGDPAISLHYLPVTISLYRRLKRL